MLTSKTVLALGADMKNRFLAAKGKDLRFGPDIGDLGDGNNYRVFKKEAEKAIKKYKPDIIACDLHPGYFSTRLLSTRRPSLVLRSLGKGGSVARRLISVQHHHAHIASVIHEHGLKEPVIGVSFDGTGYGSDGNIWGGEFLLVSKNKFERLAYLKYRKMPGGEKVAREPWRMALSILGERAKPFLKSVSGKEKDFILSMISKNINSPLTSSAGRIFDAAAALLGMCERASYEAEGPVKLEAICGDNVKEGYDFSTSKHQGSYVIDVEPIFSGMVGDIKNKKNKSLIAAKFHNSIVLLITQTVKKMSEDTKVRTVALSGGVFQNKYLKTKAIDALRSLGFKAFTNDKTPLNDFNISLGQYYVASCANLR